MRPASLALVLAVGLVACAPQVDGPVEHQRAVDRSDADRLAAQLAQLPGAIRAEVTLHRPVADPLAPAAPPPPPSAAIVLVVDDQADRAALDRATHALVQGTAPEIAAPAVAIELGAIRPRLAKVGPFTVEAASKGRLVAVLVVALATIAGLAAWLAWRERWRLGPP